MASPIAHSIAALLIHEGAGWPRRIATVFGFVLLANLCDLDMLISKLISGDHNEWHRGASHSIVACVGAALLVAAFWRTGSSYLRRFLLFFGLIGSHLVIDLVTGPRLGFVRAYGAPLLWPFTSEKFASPVSLIVGPRHKDVSQMLDATNLISVAFEAISFGTLAVLVLWIIRRVRDHRPARSEKSGTRRETGNHHG